MYRGIGLNFDPLVMAAGAQAKAELEAQRRYEELARKDAALEMQAQQAAAQFGYTPRQIGQYSPQVSVIPETAVPEANLAPAPIPKFSQVPPAEQSIPQIRDALIKQGMDPSVALNKAVQAYSQLAGRAPSSMLPPEITGQDIVDPAPQERAPAYSPYNVPPSAPQGYLTPFEAQRQFELQKTQEQTKAAYDRILAQQAGGVKRAEIQAASKKSGANAQPRETPKEKFIRESLDQALNTVRSNPVALLGKSETQIAEALSRARQAALPAIIEQAEKLYPRDQQTPSKQISDEEIKKSEVFKKYKAKGWSDEQALQQIKSKLGG